MYQWSGSLSLLLMILIGLIWPSYADEPAITNWAERAAPHTGASPKAIFCLGWRDLTGRGGDIRFRAAAPRCAARPKTPRPVLFLRWHDKHRRTTYVQALIHENGNLRPIWKTALSGPGFSAINDILLGPEKTNGLLDITLSLTSLPNPGDAQFRPGPPMTLQIRRDPLPAINSHQGSDVPADRC